jgi:hypothetical protein
MSSERVGLEWELKFRPGCDRQVQKAIVGELSMPHLATAALLGNLNPHQLLVAAIYMEAEGPIYVNGQWCQDAQVAGKSVTGSRASVSFAGTSQRVLDLLVSVQEHIQSLRGSMDGDDGGPPQRFGLHHDKVWSAAPRIIYPGDPSCPEALMQALAQLSNTDVLMDLVQNPNCPPEVLVHLVGSSEPTVRGAALVHPNLPEEYRALHSAVR